MHVDQVTVTLRRFEKTSSKESTDDSKVLSSFGPIQSGELVLADAVEVHHKPWLLLATQNQGDLMFFQIDGERLLLHPEHQGSSFSYRSDENGDVLVYIQPVNRDEGLPHVIRLDGVIPALAAKEEHLLLQELADDTAHQIETFQLPNPRPLTSLVYDCSRMLQIEAALGDPSAALRSCGLAREKLLKWTACGKGVPDCESADANPIARMLDKRVKQALETDTYRKFANSVCCEPKFAKD